MYPSDLKYSKTHQWARVEGNVATMGITFYAQDQMQDLVYIELPEAGSDVSVGDVMGSIESVKAVSDVQAPVSGTITEVNEGLADVPEKMNQSPYQEGWIAKIKPSNLEGDLANLMDASAYTEYLKTLST